MIEKFKCLCVLVLTDGGVLMVFALTDGCKTRRYGVVDGYDFSTH
jgi:hypothetical protein